MGLGGVFCLCRAGLVGVCTCLSISFRFEVWGIRWGGVALSLVVLAIFLCYFECCVCGCALGFTIFVCLRGFGWVVIPILGGWVWVFVRL